jgi:hypothetical protein
VLDGYVYSFPTVQDEITGGRSSITGDFNLEEAQDLANILNFISSNLLYIVGGICVIALIYVYAPKRGKKK